MKNQDQGAAVAASSAVLIPPDPKRCQTEITERLGAFQLGGPPKRTYRCANKPVVIATEKKIDPAYGERGSMSLCAECLKKFKKQMPSAATFRRLS